MATELCLLSRGRSSKSCSKPTRGFLALPGELRNDIYWYYFQHEFRCEFAASGRSFKKRKQRVVKLSTNLLSSFHKSIDSDKQPKETRAISALRISRLLGKYNVVKGLQTSWPTSLFSLNLVCKLIHAETVAFIYTQTTFCFDAPKRICNLLDVVSRPKLEQITRLELHYSTYGHPQVSRDVIWKAKHHESWTRACKSLSKVLLGLKNLEIHVLVNDHPLKFSLREKWVSPLLHFRRLTGSTSTNGTTATPQRTCNLKNVKAVVLSSLVKSSFGGVVLLARANRELHHLFGEALSLAILGASEQEAMVGFNKVWEGKYRLWQDNFGFAPTTW